ncbi:peptidase M10A and M12B matrixin and adamalysin [Natrinema saccharevitans]|uniref:Peptidase M10A and M12B matrixin and adamalysin n=1 Tax=Natrinema saccharevitans TaxID=301967 RepID=A0A1S8AUH7_9EURY|nr:peptidase M10A and M12B matrixin and adamalysin [Natrinema saccharevitans]OLZ40380.1 peptidase M10A and M12B matrixin and adamalysin [Natrinema saccharevitans]
MKRRVFLGTVGSAASLGTLAYTTRSDDDALAVRIWLSERAGRYDGVADRVREFLARTLAPERRRVEPTVGGTVAVSTEDAARLTSRGEWPLALAAGRLGRRDIDPVSGVNLLVTDGGMRDAPTGYGGPRVASVGGARHIERLESVDDLLGDDWVAPVTTAARTMHVLLHEVGHALGLAHRHGVAARSGDTVVATPMLSSYAWAPDFDPSPTRCGGAIPQTDGLERRLDFAFSACARRELDDDGRDGGRPETRRQAGD